MAKTYLDDVAESLQRSVIETKDYGEGAGKVAFIDGKVEPWELDGVSKEYYILSEVCYWEDKNKTQITAVSKDAVIDHRAR